MPLFISRSRLEEKLSLSKWRQEEDFATALRVRLSGMSQNVYIAYTGGTIGMRQDGGSYCPAPGYLLERMQAMPELHAPEMPRYSLREYRPLLDSSNMNPDNWQEIARDICERAGDYDGFVIIHGTDTMAYSASALSFMLENLPKPVILTGSQIPLAEVRSDARENLITSMLLAAHYPVPEVCLYLNGRLLRGNRTVKVSSSGFEAFDSPNYPPLGEVGVEIRLLPQNILPLPSAPLRLQSLEPVPIGALRLFPGITASLVRNYLQEPLLGLILETYGSGNAPADRALLEVLAAATARGVVIVNCTQCLRGSVNMAGYATGNALAEAGVISGYDMTAEAALTKLLYLFSKGLNPDEIRVQMQLPLRGELTR